MLHLQHCLRNTRTNVVVLLYMNILLMARFLVLCWILVNAHLVSAIGADSEEKQVIAEALMARKLGKHDLYSKITAPSPSPSEDLRVEGSGGAAEEQVMENNHHHHHRRSIDKSVAGGGAILGVLAIGFLVAVYCYIRATGRKHVEPGSPTDTSSIGRKNVESGSVSHP